MLEDEWALLIYMTLETTRISANRKSRLFEFEAAMRVMAIGALHRALEHAVMKGHVELRLHFGVAT